MRNVLVDGLDVIDTAARKHPELRGPLITWLETTQEAQWHSITDVRETYPSADGVPIRKGKKVTAVVTVFNVGGNNFRLLARVGYALQHVRVLGVLTHAEYDKQQWKRRA